MIDKFPPGFRADKVSCGEVALHVVHNGPAYAGSPLADKRKPLILLHGFPEFWIAWEAVMTELGEEFLILVPDQRGYNKSDAPAGEEAYRAKRLVGDIVAMADAMLGNRAFALGGHDWGASISYALAINFPQRIERLLIANGVHPVCFQRALIDHKAQAEASSYFEVLRRPDAASLMCADDFRRTFGMFERFSGTPWLTPELKAQYRAAWSGEERMAAMLHWYNSSPIVVPNADVPNPPAPLYEVGPDKMRVAMPHVLVWGNRDQALLPECHADLGQFCDDLEKIEVPEADHWILHTHAKQVANALRTLIRR